MDAVVIGAENPHPAKTLYRSNPKGPSYLLDSDQANPAETVKTGCFCRPNVRQALAFAISAGKVAPRLVLRPVWAGEGVSA
jgi:hypothetical protein